MPEEENVPLNNGAELLSGVLENYEDNLAALAVLRVIQGAVQEWVRGGTGGDH